MSLRRGLRPWVVLVTNGGHYSPKRPRMNRLTSQNPIVPELARPDWVHYPEQLHELVRSGRLPLVPWYFDLAGVALNMHRRFRSRLGRELMPFAYRQDREDLACFEKGKGQEVFIIHDNCDAGFEDEDYFASFADWIRDVEAEAAEWKDDRRQVPGDEP